MNALRNKDPKIYNKDFTFFDNTDAGEKSKVAKKKGAERPYAVRDMKREAVLKKMKSVLNSCYLSSSNCHSLI
jgi:hypothetical protein